MIAQPTPATTLRNLAIGGAATAATPGSHSQTSGSHGTAASENGSAEKDPFLSLLEQLAENEQNSQGGPSELDFFLGASGVGGGVDGAGGEAQGMLNNDGGEDGRTRVGGTGAPGDGSGGGVVGNEEMSGVVQ